MTTLADLEEFGRFAEPALLILVSLADGAPSAFSFAGGLATRTGKIYFAL